MPKVDTNQVQAGKNGAPQLYGTQKVENTIPFQEKLMRLFKPQEFVTIKNIDDEDVYWQYLPVEGEDISYDESGIQKQVTRDLPELWTIPAGESEVLVGASAYRALDVMYKNWAAKSTLRKYKDPTSQLYDEKGSHLPRNFNFADGGTQDAFIRQAYLGKAIPTFGAAPVATVQERPVIEPTEVAAMPVVTTSEQKPNIQPMSAQAPVDETIPKPKTTEGAPLAPVTYADPDSTNTQTFNEIATKGAKTLVGNEK
jgi:hypothetical protein